MKTKATRKMSHDVHREEMEADLIQILTSEQLAKGYRKIVHSKI